MPLSDDPDARARQLANLQRGKPTGTTWKAGVAVAPALKHGLRSRTPPRVVLDPLVQEIEQALAADLPLRGPDGATPGPDRYAVELAAIALLRVRRVSHYLALHGDVDEHGRMRPELDGLGRAVEHAARMLDRLGCSPRARAQLGLDLAQTHRALHGAGDDALLLEPAAQELLHAALERAALDAVAARPAGDAAEPPPSAAEPPPSTADDAS